MRRDESKSLWIIVLVLLWVKKGRKGHGASKLDMDRVWAAAFLSTRTEQDRTRDSREYIKKKEMNEDRKKRYGENKEKVGRVLLG